MTIYRLTVRHRSPMGHDAAIARGVLARTVHGLDGHGELVLLDEHSTPGHARFTFQARDHGTVDGLMDVARVLDGGPGWVAWCSVVA